MYLPCNSVFMLLYISGFNGLSSELHQSLFQYKNRLSIMVLILYDILYHILYKSILRLFYLYNGNPYTDMNGVFTFKRSLCFVIARWGHAAWRVKRGIRGWTCTSYVSVPFYFCSFNWGIHSASCIFSCYGSQYAAKNPIQSNSTHYSQHWSPHNLIKI